MVAAPIYRSAVNIAVEKAPRPICKVCNQRPRAVAYHKYDRVYYRSRCDHCIRRDRTARPQEPGWRRAGYEKKKTCDRCRFRARYQGQLMVYYVDGDLRNNDLRNLRTICQNCAVEVTRLDLPWRPGGLEPDR